VGYRHSREDLLAAAIDAVAEEGLTKLSFGRLAARLGIRDRTLVYYFPTKRDLLEAVIGSFAIQLQELLDDAFGPEPLPATELMARAWPALTTDEADRTFSVFFEFIGLAGAGLQPYAELAPVLVNAWIDWLVDRIDEPDPVDRLRRARTVVAQLDGLLLLRRTAGGEAAHDAAIEIGIVPS
jgi:AcrR family transcriptional regulator